MKYLLSFFLLLFLSCQSTEKSQFEKLTGLKIEEPIEILKESDTYLLHEGEWSVIFKTTKKQIKQWLKNNPPWNVVGWDRGNVNPVIAMHCRFGNENFCSYADNGVEKYLSCDPSLLSIFNNPDNYYTYENRCCGGDLEFHNGSLLIINANTNTVYLSVWDY